MWRNSAAREAPDRGGLIGAAGQAGRAAIVTVVFAYSPSTRHDDAGFVVVTDRFVCLLSGDASLDTVHSVFAALDAGGGGLEDALSHVGAVERFAIAETSDPGVGTVRIAVRGEVSVGIEGASATRVPSPEDATWIMGEATGVSSLWLSLGEHAPEGDVLPLARGVVRASAVGPQPGAARAEASRHWVLRLPDGNEVDADGIIVIGRGSWEQEPEGNEIRHLSVPSPLKRISGSHLELAIVDGQLVARDLDSTNGTIVITPERAPRLLHKGDTTALQAGDILDLGESLQIVVSNRA